MGVYRILVIMIGILWVGVMQLWSQTTDQQEPTPNINFDWAFGALVGQEKSFVTITRDTVLKSGDELKMMVRLQSECYVYVVFYGSKGEVELLFPYSLQQFQKDYTIGKNYYIPQGRMWMKLDQNTGKERFFIVASSERLLKLEALLSEYFASKGEATKKEKGERVIAEIRELRKSFASYATIAEKPITIGGNIRSTSTVEDRRRIDLADFAIAIRAKNFYSKTFTIDHQ
ncbi:MAG: DUF4384 domain-containing protein [Bacteroidetes bacterium]|nr:DUF4384 domain-containing protein [Bacteroidota bacterium]